MKYDLDQRNIHIFNELYGITNEQGVRLDFKDHAFLWDIYEDLSPKQVIYKAAQVGFSTLAIIKSFWLAKNKGLNVVYTLPTQDDVNDFVGSKVNPIISQNPILQGYVKDRDTIEQKRVGQNVIFYRGTYTSHAALMVSSDLNIIDEFDRSKQAIVAQYASRLQHSKFKWEWYFSNPSVEGNGVSQFWPKSDQKHWFIKCLKCTKEQFLSWPQSICPERQIYQCKWCQEELNDEARRKGRWIARFKNKEFSGYWINLMMTPWTSAKQILQYQKEKSAEYFYNFVLGLPYVGEGNKVTPDIIFRNCTSKINNQERVIIGCDSGLTKHFVLGNTEGLFYHGKTQRWEDIAGYLDRFQGSVAVIDALPDLTEPRKLKEQYLGRVFLCYFGKDRKTMQFIRWGENNEYGNVVVDRNRTLQLVIDEFANQRIPLQGNQDDWQEYYAHWADLYRINEWEEAKLKGDVNYMYKAPFRWDSRTGNDHWAFATLYWRVGMDRFGGSKAAILNTGLLSLPTAPRISVTGEVEVDLTKRFIYPRRED